MAKPQPTSLLGSVGAALKQGLSKLGFPFPSVDPMKFLVDDEIRAFIIDKRHDLASPDAPILSTGLFIVHEHVVPDNTAEVIHGVFPHCWRRDNPTTADETVVLLTPEQVAGWVIFNQTKNNNQPYLVEIDYNSPTLSTAPNDLDRQSVGGSTFLPEDAPRTMDNAMQNSLKTFYLPAKSVFRVTFRLTPVASNSPVPNPWVLGANPEPDVNNRIDFAGAMVYGVRMPQRMYDQLKIARRTGKLGAEAHFGD